jgi:HAD superfamily hydrolase (TIGR01549 family)
MSKGYRIMADNILIFDFDGTIADTHHYIIKIANSLAPEYGFKKIDWEEAEAVRDKTAKEIISYLGVPILKIPAILTRAKRIFHDGINDVKLIDGLHDVLHELHRRKILMGIVSSNDADNIEHFLDNHDLKVFDFLHSTTKIWSKHHSLAKLIKSRKFDKEKVLYIGDETRDISAARKCGIRSVAVSWGYNSHKTLAADAPDYILEKPAELLEL